MSMLNLSSACAFRQLYLLVCIRKYLLLPLRLLLPRYCCCCCGYCHCCHYYCLFYHYCCHYYYLYYWYACDSDNPSRVMCIHFIRSSTNVYQLLSILFPVYLTFLTDSLGDYRYVRVVWLFQLRRNRDSNWRHWSYDPNTKARHGYYCNTCTDFRSNCLPPYSMHCRWDL